MAETKTTTSKAEKWGRLASPGDEEQQRAAALRDPGAYHGDIASAELHWFDADNDRWLRRDPESGAWSGFSATTGEALETPGVEPGWRPWVKAFDDSEAPFFRWFSGGLTNACFNEVDRHVLGGRGAHPAFVFEGDRWDPSRNGGQGGPVFELEIDYRSLLIETVLRAEVLSGLGLKQGDRVAFNLPNIPEQLYYTEAA